MDVIDSYAALASARGMESLSGPAVRTRSVAARSIFAHLASGGECGYDQLITSLTTTGRPPETMLSGVQRRRWTLGLARVMAAQSVLDTDRTHALALCEAVYQRAGADAFDADQQTIYAQLLLLERQFARADAVLSTLTRLPRVVRHYLRSDLASPLLRSDQGNEHAWLELLNEPFLAAGLEPVQLTAEGTHPFDRLDARPAETVDGGPLVSVIMSAFRPDDSLFAAVRSILKQSLANLELIVVDDASGPEYDARLGACAALDPRITVVRAPVNGGTYMVRNAGLDRARGEFVTFQDSDDWSHPRRIERQLAPLLADPELVATRSMAIRAHDDLAHQWLGYSAQRVNASSLLFRKEPVMGTIGYFDSVRKSADLEYAFRLEAALGKTIRDVEEPLAYTRLRMTSLSRLDFTLGWAAPARIAYQAAYRHWHRSVAGGADPYVPRDLESRPFPAPAAYLNCVGAVEAAPPRYDVVYVDDWQQQNSLKVGATEELTALTRRGLKVAIVQAESVAAMVAKRTHINSDIQDLVNSGVIDRVTLDDEAVASMVVVRDPVVLQFPQSIPAKLQAGQVIVTITRPPSDYAGLPTAYDVPSCTDHARALFGVDPLWTAVHPTLAAALPRSGIDRWEQILGIPVALDRWTTPPRRRGPRPVIGRYDADNALSWPDTAEELLSAYPESDRVDLRVMGSAQAVRDILNRRLPPRWLVYRRNDVSLRTFLFQLDFYVYFPSGRLSFPPVDMLVRAMAAGTVVVLPERFSPLFGDAAVYCAAEQVAETVCRYHRDSAGYDRQVAKGREFAARHHSATEYADAFEKLLARIG